LRAAVLLRCALRLNEAASRQAMRRGVANHTISNNKFDRFDEVQRVGAKATDAATFFAGIAAKIVRRVEGLPKLSGRDPAGPLPAWPGVRIRKLANRTKARDRHHIRAVRRGCVMTRSFNLKHFFFGSRGQAPALPWPPPEPLEDLEEDARGPSPLAAPVHVRSGSARVRIDNGVLVVEREGEPSGRSNSCRPSTSTVRRRSRVLALPNWCGKERRSSGAARAAIRSAGPDRCTKPVSKRGGRSTRPRAMHGGLRSHGRSLPPRS
jgi:hypothetical protein